MAVIKDYELAIIGGGPAGLTACIYAKRAGINAVLFEEKMAGGQAASTWLIENYPGFEGISGAELTARMKAHASKYAKIIEMAQINGVKAGTDKVEISTDGGDYEVGAVILATGADHKKLGVKGEKEFTGRGVSYCAVCDATFFKGKKVAVVGGGNSAAAEALYLRDVGCDVYMIHRRNQLRAEQALQNALKTKGVNFIFDSVVEEIHGARLVDGITLKHARTNILAKMDVSAVFISVGEEPKNELAKKLGIALDERGYVIVDAHMRTSVKRVYAAGDITGGVRQVITACAKGAIAALSCTEALGKQYPF